MKNDRTDGFHTDHPWSAAIQYTLLCSCSLSLKCRHVSIISDRSAVNSMKKMNAQLLTQSKESLMLEWYAFETVKYKLGAVERKACLYFQASALVEISWNNFHSSPFWHCLKEGMWKVLLFIVEYLRACRRTAALWRALVWIEDDNALNGEFSRLTRDTRRTCVRLDQMWNLLPCEIVKWSSWSFGSVWEWWSNRCRAPLLLILSQSK